VCVEIGLNDLNPATATATSIAALQDLITTIRAGVSSSCKIIMCTMIPCYNRLVTVYGGSAGDALIKWRAMNEAIMGRGASAITSVDARTEDHTTALTTLVSVNETLNATYDTGDGIHENNAGRQIVAAAWRDALESLGLI
jgi:lysophospholipase L1-like esterase